MPDAVTALVVTNAPELGEVPQVAWAEVVRFIATQRTGQVIWNFNQGRLESLDTRTHTRVRRRALGQPE